MSGNSSKRSSPSLARSSLPKTTPNEELSSRGTTTQVPSSERPPTPAIINESIFDALSQPLPALEAVNNWLPASCASWSNAKTAITCPPAYSDEVSVGYYVDKADKKLQSNSVRQALKSISNPILDPLMRKRVEADVVRYGNEVLVYQVNCVLASIYSDQIQSLTEYEVNKCRPDKVWKKAVPRTGEEKHLFAMIESKSSQSIRLDEFELARRRDGKVFINSAGVKQKEGVQSREKKTRKDLGQ